MKSPWYILYGFAVILIGLSVWATVQPSHLNWGIHCAAFFDIGIQAAALLLALTMLLPAVQAAVVTGAGRLAAAGEKGSWKWILLVVAAISAALWFYFPAKLHLLGDGAILLRSIPGYESVPGIPESFRNQPLFWFIFHGCEAVLNLFTTASPHDVYVALDLVSGLLFIGVIAWAMKRVSLSPGERVLLGAVLLFGGGYQFFFGYVENYVLQYVATAAYALTGWLSLTKKCSVWVPVFFFVLLIGLHLGDLVYLPSLAYLALAQSGMDLRANRRKVVLVATGAVIGALGLLTALGFNIVSFAGRFINGSPDFLPLVPGNGDYYPYSLFSVWHLIDWLNCLVRIVPLSLGLIASSIVAAWGTRNWLKPEAIFLIAVSAGGLFFTGIVNSALGMARDWDLLSSFFLPLSVLAVYAVAVAPAEGRAPVLAAAAGLSMLHIALFIGINADAKKHLARMEMLDSPKLLSVSSRLFHDEALANYYYDDGRYDAARVHYERYLRSGTLNPRVIANLSDCYRKLEMREPYFAILKRAADLRSPNPGVYSNLAVEYITRGDTTMAIWMNRKCIGMDSAQVQAYANLSIIYLNSDKPDSSLMTARLAVRYGFADPVIWRVMGKSQIKLGRYAEAVGSYNRYLQTNPRDTAIREQRDRVAEAARRLGQMQ